MHLNSKINNYFCQCAKVVNSEIFASNFQYAVIILDYGVSTKDRVLIVDKHNEYRQQIAENYVPNQPRGVDLMKLVRFPFKPGSIN